MKSIIFKIELSGEGVVNFDDSSQRFLFIGEGNKLKQLFHPHDNVKYAKKVLYHDADGNLDSYKLKISSKCLGKSVFDMDMVGQNTNFIMNKEVLYSQLGSPYYMLSGYVFTVKDSTSFKRKSAITLCDAIQTNNAQSMIETFTRSGFKKIKVEKSDKSDTSLFNEETVGEITYSAKGIINLNDLQFVSLDDYYDRWSFSPDEFDTFSKYMKMSIPSFDSKVGYYKLKGSVNSFPELGFKFSDTDVDFLTKYFLKRLLGANIRRKDAYAQIDSLKVKYVNDISDTFKSEDGWINIKSEKDVDNLTITPNEFYTETDFSLAVETRKTLIPAISAEKEPVVKEPVVKKEKAPAKKKEAIKIIED